MILFINIHQIDVILLVETWLNQNILTDELRIYFPNFHLKRIDRDCDHAGGILALVSKNLIVHEENKGITPDLEFLHISIERNLTKTFQILILYKSSTNDIAANVILNDILSNVNYKNLPFIIIGDININLKSKNIATNKIHDTLTCYGFNIHDIGYTRVTAHSKTAIDWIATNFLASKTVQDISMLKNVDSLIMIVFLVE